MAKKSNKKERRVFVRRSARPLNTSRQAAMDEWLPQLSIDMEMLKEDGSLDINQLFDQKYQHHVFEIGFGTGEHLAAMMRANPDTGYCGAEPFKNGMAAFLKNIKDMEDKNVRVIMDDAMFLANSLQNESLDEIYILNPDPWHKTRHHKRRIINQENLDVFARILKPGGRLVSSTDVPYLAEWVATHIHNHSSFVWVVNSCKDWQNRPEWWFDHKYAVKGAKGAQKMHYFVFHKV